MKAEKEVVFGYKGRVMNGIDLSGSFKTLKCQKIIGRKNTELMVSFITHVAVPSYLTQLCGFQSQLPSHITALGTCSKFAVHS